MKTAERILVTSLELFNQQGENAVTCVDIALELDISPGNLYYHYKGKEIIVGALFDMYQERVNKILTAPADFEISVGDFFYVLLLLFQSNHLFRFLFRNPGDIGEKYSNIGKGFRRMLQEQEKNLEQILALFIAQGHLRMEPAELTRMVQLISLVFTQSLNYALLKGDDGESESYIYDSLASILFALAPYMQIEPEVLAELQAMVTE